MQIRLHDDWARTVGVGGLDEDRLALYMLTQRLSLAAGPLLLLDTDSRIVRSCRASPNTT